MHTSHFVRCLSTIWFWIYTDWGAWLQWNKNPATAYQAISPECAPPFMLNRFCRNRNYYRMHNQMLKTFLFDIISFLQCVCECLFDESMAPANMHQSICAVQFGVFLMGKPKQTRNVEKQRNTDIRQPLIIPYCTRHFGRFALPTFCCRWMDFSLCYSETTDFSAFLFARLLFPLFFSCQCDKITR